MKNRIAKKWAKKIRAAKERDIIENQLINPIILQRVVNESCLCKHALRELNIAAKEHGSIIELMHFDIMSLLALVSIQGHSNNSIHYMLNIFDKLVRYKIITPLKLNEDEWNFHNYDDSYQNRRATNIFKEKTGEIIDIYAFSVKTNTIYDIKKNEFRINHHPICYNSTLYEYTDNILTGRYFKRCKIKPDERGEYTPKDSIIIPCVEIEYAPYDFIMCVDKVHPKLTELEKQYDIIWQYDSKLDGVKLKDLTKEIIDHE